MSGYKRFISYVYNYEHEIRKNNAGYVRTEIRGSQCKFVVHVKSLSSPNSICRVYLYIREQQKIQGIYLCDLRIQNGAGQGRIVINTVDIVDYGITFDKICGILLYQSDEKYFAAAWDNQEVSLKNFVELEKEEGKVAIAEEAVNHEDMEFLRKEKTREQAEKEIKEWEEEREGTEKITEEKLDSENKEVVEKELDLEDTEVVEKELEQESTEIIEENGLQDTDFVEKQEVYINDEWKEIFEKYPSIYPFEDEEMEQCVRITPKDLKELPGKYDSLEYNNFLLHGYGSYRHLLIAKRIKAEKCQYLLCVPGIFRQKECFIAKMFDFSDFKPLRNRGIRPGEFGYWYICLCEKEVR